MLAAFLNKPKGAFDLKAPFVIEGDLMKSTDVFSGIIQAIPENLKQRMLKEIQHSLTINLCSYDSSYVSHTVFHFTSAESPHLPEVTRQITDELAEAGWFLAFKETDKHFLEIFISSDAALVSPIHKAAFTEACGLDFPENNEDEEEFEEFEESQPTVMRRLEAVELAAQAIEDANIPDVKLYVIRTSAVGPQLKVTVKGKDFMCFAADPNAEQFTIRYKIASGSFGVFTVEGIGAFPEVVKSFAGAESNKLAKLFVKLQEGLSESAKHLTFQFNDGEYTILVVEDGDLTVSITETDAVEGLDTDLFILTKDGQDPLIAEADDILSVLMA